MPHETEALKSIALALKQLEDARTEISAALVRQANADENDPAHRRLAELHNRVSKAIDVLPHGGGSR